MFTQAGLPVTIQVATGIEIAISQRTVDAVEQILKDQVYHYHSKMIMKDPQIGGAWAWDQGCGYWYHTSLLWPDRCGVSIAVDAATKENGCMQVKFGPEKTDEIMRNLNCCH